MRVSRVCATRLAASKANTLTGTPDRNLRPELRSLQSGRFEKKERPVRLSGPFVSWATRTQASIPQGFQQLSSCRLHSFFLGRRLTFATSTQQHVAAVEPAHHRIDSRLWGISLALLAKLIEPR